MGNITTGARNVAIGRAAVFGHTPLERAKHAVSAKIDGMDDWKAGEIVRAVLQAIREPSGEMIEAAWNAGHIGDNGGIERGGAGEEWQAMIDAAMNEEE